MAPDLQDMEARIAHLRGEFKRDGFEVRDEDVFRHNGRIGIVARHGTSFSKGEVPKRAYYVEGSAYEMGHLMGQMAEPLIRAMSEGYIERYAWEMLPVAAEAPEDLGEGETRLYKMLVKRVNEVLPPGEPETTPLGRRIAEMRGMAEGCADVTKGKTDVTFEKLWALNAGIDRLFSLLYEAQLGELIFGKNRANARKLDLPMGCNALAVLNDAAEDGPLFARDFMFKACGVFQDVACHVIYRPIPDDTDREPLAMVAMTAPGFVGSISAMNVHGVAAGVDVVHGDNNTPEYLGMNSLLLVRDVIEHSKTIEVAAGRILDTDRGVTWLYPMAADGGEGKNDDRAAIVEASATPRDDDGRKLDRMPYLDHARRELKRPVNLLPDQEFLDAHPTVEPQWNRNGAMVRWENFEDPEDYIVRFNEKLWKRRVRPRHAWPKVKDQFGPEGRIDASHRQWRCPSGSYFAPIRGEPGKIVLTSNHYVCPEMRISAMDKLTNLMDDRYADDSQWRYDELNHLVARERWYDGSSQTRRKTPRKISYDAAKRLINFLEPKCAGDGRCPYKEKRECFHFKKYHPEDCTKPAGGRTIPIEGVVSLFDLRRRTIESYFGYYGDDWVKLRLLPYVDGAR